MADTIAKQWKKFSDAVMPPNVNPIQVQEMRRAFYAGVQGCINIQYEIGEECGEDLEEGALAIQKINEELDRFAKDIEEGRA